MAPLWRARIVTSAVLLLAVVAATWWAVSWLTSPAGPAGVPAPQAAVLDGQAEQGGDEPGGTEERSEVGAGRGGPASASSGSAGAGETGAGKTETGTTETGGTGPGRSGGGPSGAAGAGSSEVLIVHVTGEVHEPGLVELPAGARVADALSAAGGPTPQAHLDRLNLAAPAVDASQIVVPGPYTPVAGSREAPGAAPGVQPGAADAGNPGGAGGPGDAGGTVNVNTADAATLEQLPGIGPALAGRIIEHRDQVGPFGSLADLDAVSGIGPAMMERLDGLVSW